MTDLEEARKFFDGDRYSTELTGCRIDEIGENYAKCSVKITDKLCNAQGGIMGGVMFTLADFTFAAATNFRKPYTVNVSSSINFMTMPKGDTLIAESKLLKDGRRNCFYEINVRDNLGNAVAFVTVNGVHLSTKKSETENKNAR